MDSVHSSSPITLIFKCTLSSSSYWIMSNVIWRKFGNWKLIIIHFFQIWLERLLTNNFVGPFCKVYKIYSFSFSLSFSNSLFLSWVLGFCLEVLKTYFPRSGLKDHIWQCSRDHVWAQTWISCLQGKCFTQYNFSGFILFFNYSCKIIAILIVRI